MKPSTRLNININITTTCAHKPHSKWRDLVAGMIAVRRGMTTGVIARNTVSQKICDSAQHLLTVAKSRTDHGRHHATTAETTAEEIARHPTEVVLEAAHLPATTETATICGIVIRIEAAHLEGELAIEAQTADRMELVPRHSRVAKPQQTRTLRCRRYQKTRTRKLR